MNNNDKNNNDDVHYVYYYLQTLYREGYDPCCYRLSLPTW